MSLKVCCGMQPCHGQCMTYCFKGLLARLIEGSRGVGMVWVPTPTNSAVCSTNRTRSPPGFTNIQYGRVSHAGQGRWVTAHVVEGAVKGCKACDSWQQAQGGLSCIVNYPVPCLGQSVLHIILFSLATLQLPENIFRMHKFVDNRLASACTIVGIKCDTTYKELTGTCKTTS